MAYTDGWTIATAIGTIGATLSALGIALWQGIREKYAAKEIRRAIAPALIDDLASAHKLLDVVQSLASEIHDVRVANQTRIHNILRLVHTLNAPAFDRFVDLLPKLGTSTAPKVIAVYGRIIRTGDAVRSYAANKEDAKLELASIVNSLKRNAQPLQNNIQEAIALLKRFTDSP